MLHPRQTLNLLRDYIINDGENDIKQLRSAIGTANFGAILRKTVEWSKDSVHGRFSFLGLAIYVTASIHTVKLLIDFGSNVNKSSTYFVQHQGLGSKFSKTPLGLLLIPEKEREYQALVVSLFLTNGADPNRIAAMQWDQEEEEGFMTFEPQKPLDLSLSLPDGHQTILQLLEAGASLDFYNKRVFNCEYHIPLENLTTVYLYGKYWDFVDFSPLINIISNTSRTECPIMVQQKQHLITMLFLSGVDVSNKRHWSYLKTRPSVDSDRYQEFAHHLSHGMLSLQDICVRSIRARVGRRCGPGLFKNLSQMGLISKQVSRVLNLSDVGNTVQNVLPKMANT